MNYQRYESESGDILMVLTGESLPSRKLSLFREEGFLKLRDLLHSGDFTFGNAECLFQNYEDTPNTLAGGGSPTGTYMATPSELIKELQWLGINIVSTANNHASDFGEAGVMTSLRYLDEGGMPHAGSGANLTEARAPAYLDTPRGRLALLAAADWGPRGRGGSPWPFPMGVMAAEQSPYSKGRPGVNLVRHRMRFTVPGDVFQALQRMRDGLHFPGAHGGAGGTEAGQETEFTFMDCQIVLGNEFAMSTVAEQEDLEDNYRWVRDARRMAEWVLFSFHNHGATRSPELPSDAARVLAKGVIDNGADVFIGHGPHRDRGIEIYQGKPIFYGIGNLILQNDSIRWAPYEVMHRLGLGYDHTPADFYEARTKTGFNSGIERWETAVVTCKWEKKQIKEIRLYPVDLGGGLPRSVNGRPVLAPVGSEVNQRVLRRFQDMSEPYGTKVLIDNGVGIICP